VTSNEVDRALAAPPGEVGTRLLAIREDQWYDRKSSRIAAKDLAAPMVALGNAEGGVLVIGLSNGMVEGIGRHRDKLNSFRQAPFDFTVPPVRATFDEVPCMNSSGDNDTLLVIRVEPGERVHETNKAECYLRVGDESRKLTFAQRRELEFDKGASTYDGHPVQDVGIGDLDQELIENYRSKVGAQRDAASLFAARSLFTSRRELTVAGYLLFAGYPQELFPQAYIRVIRFLTPQRGTGARLGLEEGADHRIEGPVPRAIMEAARIIDDLVPRRRALRGSGTFEARPIVPRDAWLEGLVNAAIHRSYSLAGDHIRVEIYPDRIEIESPGRFPGLANPHKPLEISRFARNPRIARVCADLRIGQELGEGIKRMFDEMRRVGLTDPVYEQGQGSVRLYLRALARLDADVLSRLRPGSQQILDLLRTASRDLGTGDIADAIGMSRPSATNRLRALEREGMVRWVGKSTNDPRAVWVLTER
jgi:ATP-dependent DNA helicase RecG